MRPRGIVYLGKTECGNLFTTEGERLLMRLSRVVLPVAVPALLFSAIVLAPAPACATVIAYTNFDEPALGANTYSPGTTGKELGFTIGDTDPSVVNTRDHTDALTDLGKMDQGQCYFLKRPGTNKLIFDTVNLAAYDDVIVSVWIYVPNVTFGTTDGITISVVYDTVNTATLLSITGDTALAPYKAKWSQIASTAGAIPDSATSAYLKIGSGMSQESEDFWVDDVLFMPEPATLALVGVGMAGIIWLGYRRRRRTLA